MYRSFKFLSAVVMLAALASPAHAFIFDSARAGVASSTSIATSWPATINNGDLVVAIVYHANNTAVTTPSGWSAPSCGGTNPKAFNSSAVQIEIFTHTYSTGDTAPTFTGWGAAVVVEYEMLAWQSAAGIDACALTGTNSASATVSTADAGVPAHANDELVTVYATLTTANNVPTATTTVSTMSQSTVQHFLFSGNLGSGAPSISSYELNFGPTASPSDPGTPSATVTSAVNAGIQIELQPATIPATIYPSGAPRRNASGIAYFSQIDTFPVPGVTAWQAPAIDIIAIYRSWLGIETSCDVFDWDHFDNDILQARIWGKRVSVGINALGTTPPTASSWIYASGLCTNSGIVENVAEYWAQSFGPAKCTQVDIPDPRDTNYQHATDDFMSKLAARYGALSGPGQPIVSVKPLGFAGLGTIEYTYWNQNEGASINSGACTQVDYANGTNALNNANGAAHDWAHLASPYTTASAGSAISHFEATAIADFPNVEIINTTTDTPNQPPITGLSGTLNLTIQTNDRTNYPNKQVFEQSNALGCSGNGTTASCFSATDYLTANDPKLGLSYQYVSAQSLSSCIGTGGFPLYSPSTSDCNVPAVVFALKNGASYLELYPSDVAAALDQPWFRMFSDFVNARNQGGFF
jgi:hypothetical protein